MLEFRNQIAEANAEDFGNSQQGVQANPLFSAFNFADINRMQTGLFSQFFLTHASLFAIFTNGITQNF